jgi:hypothetical protein
MGVVRVYNFIRCVPRHFFLLYINPHLRPLCESNGTVAVAVFYSDHMLQEDPVRRHPGVPKFSQRLGLVAGLIRH